MDIQSLLVTKILLPLYSLLGGLVRRRLGQTTVLERSWDQRIELAGESTLVSKVLTQRSLLTVSNDLSISSFMSFSAKPNSVLLATCTYFICNRGNSRKTKKVIFSKAFDKIKCMNIHHSLIHLKTFIEQQLYVLIPVLDAQIYDRNSHEWSLNSSGKTKQKHKLGIFLIYLLSVVTPVFVVLKVDFQLWRTEGTLVCGGMGISLQGLPLLQSIRLEGTGSAAEAHELSCPNACGIFPHQGLSPCPLYW